MANEAAMDVATDGDGPARAQKTIYSIGTTQIYTPRDGMEFRRPLSNGLIDV